MQLLLLLALAIPGGAAPRAVVLAPARVTLNFCWTPAERTQFLRELNLHLDALAALPKPSRSASIPAEQTLVYLRENADRGLVTPVELAARQTVLEAMARPVQALPWIEDVLAQDPRGAEAARKLGKLSREAAAARDSPKLRRGLARLRKALLTNSGGLRDGSWDLYRVLTSAFDGEAFTWDKDLPASAVRVEFSDRRFGAFNQDDPRLDTAGLFSEKEPDRSMLCGPTCLLNAVAKFIAGRRHALDPVEELDRMAWDLAPMVGEHSETLLDEKGIGPHSLANLARLYLREKGWRTRVRIWDHSSVNESVLRSASKGGTVLILNYHRFRQGWRGRPKRTNGHYVLLTGLQIPRSRRRPLRALVQDPATGESIVRLIPQGRGRKRTYVLEFEDPGHMENQPPKEKLLLYSVVEIRLAGRIR